MQEECLNERELDETKIFAVGAFETFFFVLILVFAAYLYSRNVAQLFTLYCFILAGTGVVVCEIQSDMFTVWRWKIASLILEGFCLDVKILNYNLEPNDSREDNS